MARSIPTKSWVLVSKHLSDRAKVSSLPLRETGGGRYGGNGQNGDGNDIASEELEGEGEGGGWCGGGSGGAIKRSTDVCRKQRNGYRCGSCGRTEREENNNSFSEKIRGGNNNSVANKMKSTETLLSDHSARMEGRHGHSGHSLGQEEIGEDAFSVGQDENGEDEHIEGREEHGGFEKYVYLEDIGQDDPFVDAEGSSESSSTYSEELCPTCRYICYNFSSFRPRTANLGYRTRRQLQEGFGDLRLGHIFNNCAETKDSLAAKEARASTPTTVKNVSFSLSSTKGTAEYRPVGYRPRDQSNSGDAHSTRQRSRLDPGVSAGAIDELQQPGHHKGKPDAKHRASSSHRTKADHTGNNSMHRQNESQLSGHGSGGCRCHQPSDHWSPKDTRQCKVASAWEEGPGPGGKYEMPSPRWNERDDPEPGTTTRGASPRKPVKGASSRASRDSSPTTTTGSDATTADGNASKARDGCHVSEQNLNDSANPTGWHSARGNSQTEKVSSRIRVDEAAKHKSDAKENVVVPTFIPEPCANKPKIKLHGATEAQITAAAEAKAAVTEALAKNPQMNDEAQGRLYASEFFGKHPCIAYLPWQLVKDKKKKCRKKGAENNESEKKESEKKKVCHCSNQVVTEPMKSTKFTMTECCTHDQFTWTDNFTSDKCEGTEMPLYNQFTQVRPEDIDGPSPPKPDRSSGSSSHRTFSQRKSSLSMKSRDSMQMGRGHKRVNIHGASSRFSTTAPPGSMLAMNRDDAYRSNTTVGMATPASGVALARDVFNPPIGRSGTGMTAHGSSVAFPRGTSGHHSAETTTGMQPRGPALNRTRGDPPTHNRKAGHPVEPRGTTMNSSKGNFISYKSTTANARSPKSSILSSSTGSHEPAEAREKGVLHEAHSLVSANGMATGSARGLAVPASFVTMGQGLAPCDDDFGDWEWGGLVSAATAMSCCPPSVTNPCVLGRLWRRTPRFDDVVRAPPLCDCCDMNNLPVPRKWAR